MTISNNRKVVKCRLSRGTVLNEPRLVARQANAVRRSDSAPLFYFVSILVTLANQLGSFAVVIAVGGAVVLLLVGNRIVEKAAPESSVGSTSMQQSQTPKPKDQALHPV